MNMKKWCGEIAYMTPEGPLQSDLCHHKDGEQVSDDLRALLHKCLDEWLDKSDGTGNFVLGLEYTMDGYLPPAMCKEEQIRHLKEEQSRHVA